MNKIGAILSVAIIITAPCRAQRSEHTEPSQAWGFRLGEIGNTQYPGFHPLFQPYYEAAAGRVMMTGDVTLAFTNFSTVDIPTFRKFELLDYGFHGGVRWTGEPHGALTPFLSASAGFDVYPENPFPGRASAGIPITAGALMDLGSDQEFEAAANITPLHYLRQAWGLTYGLSVGLRFPTPKYTTHNELASIDPSTIDSKPDFISPGVNWTRTGIVAGGIATAFTALHIYQNNAWWANNRSAFHVIEDADYQSDFDKCGHAFGGYYSSHFFDEAYRWCGMDSGQASLLGALSGALYEFYVEIEDGFASWWGFSRGDAKADIAGATFYLATQRVPFLRNFRYKWMYTPTDKLLKDQPDIPGQTVNFIEDYGGQTYYLSANIHNMLPENVQKYWPRWLDLAAGVSGYDINYPDFSHRHKAWYLSLDYDLDNIIPETPYGFVNMLIRGLGYWHFPAPAWRIYPDHRFFWTFPLSISFDHGLHLGAEPSLGRTE